MDRSDPSLPEPVRRWLAHAIAPGTELAPAARLTMAGRIKLGRRWHRFHATQLLAPGRGYVWAARTNLYGLRVRGFDRYSDGTAELHWRLGGLATVMSAAGADITASAAGRLAGELALLPTAYGVAHWRPGNDDDSFIGTVGMDDRQIGVDFRVAMSGRLREVRMQRWGNPNGRAFGRYPFGVLCHDESTYAGITVPSRITAGWFAGTYQWDEGVFYRARILDVTPLG